MSIWIKKIFRGRQREKGRAFIALVVAAGKSHKELIAMPEGFDISEHIKTYPPYEWGFPHGKIFEERYAYTFLFLLTSIPARNSDLIREDGYISISMRKVRNSIKDIRQYVEYLDHTGVISIRKQYIPGEKCRGYKWGQRYEDSPFIIREEITGFADEVYKYTNKQGDSFHLPDYIAHWYNESMLNIDERALEYALRIKEGKMQDTSRASWDLNSDTGEYKYPVTQYISAIRNIGKLIHHSYEAHFDNNVHRLHSTLTNLRKDLRNFISYDGRQLYGIDVKNCQPYLACLILNPAFWTDGSELPVNIYNLPNNIRNLFTSSKQLQSSVQEFFVQTNPNRFEEYVGLVSSGEIYEYIIGISAERLGEKITREQAKTLMFSILFSSNQGSHWSSTIRKMKQFFEQDLFPEVAELFRIIKNNYKDSRIEKPHSRLSVILQSIESRIILHRCCRRIWEEGDQSIPVFTIHDSVITIEEARGMVESILTEELTKCVGASPRFGVEEWSINNLD